MGSCLSSTGTNHGEQGSSFNSFMSKSARILGQVNDAYTRYNPKYARNYQQRYHYNSHNQYGNNTSLNQTLNQAANVIQRAWRERKR